MNVNSFELSLLIELESRVLFNPELCPAESKAAEDVKLLWLLTDTLSHPPDEDINRFVSSLMT